MAVVMEAGMCTDYGRIGTASHNAAIARNGHVGGVEVGVADRQPDKTAVRRIASDTSRLEREAEARRHVSEHERRRISFPSLAHAHLSTPWARNASRSFWGMEMLYALEQRFKESSNNPEEPSLFLEDLYNTTDSNDSGPNEETDERDRLEFSSSPESGSEDIPRPLPVAGPSREPGKKRANSLPLPIVSPRDRSSSPQNTKPQKRKESSCSFTTSTCESSQRDLPARRRSYSLQTRHSILNGSPQATKEGCHFVSRASSNSAQSNSSPRKLSSSLESRPVILNWSSTTTLKSMHIKRASDARQGKQLPSLRKTSSFEFPTI